MPPTKTPEPEFIERFIPVVSSPSAVFIRLDHTEDYGTAVDAGKDFIVKRTAEVGAPLTGWFVTVDKRLVVL